MDIPVEAVLLPQDAQRLDHQLHRAVGRTQHRARQKQALDIVAAVKADRQLCQLPRGKGSPRPVIGAAVDAVAAVIAADIRVQHLQKRHAAPIRRKGMADARRCAAAQTAVPSRASHAAGGAGHIIFGAVCQYLKLFRKVHSARLLKKGYKKYSPPHILA